MWWHFLLLSQKIEMLFYSLVVDIKQLNNQQPATQTQTCLPTHSTTRCPCTSLAATLARCHAIPTSAPMLSTRRPARTSLLRSSACRRSVRWVAWISSARPTLRASTTSSRSSTLTSGSIMMLPGAFRHPSPTRPRPSSSTTSAGTGS